MVYEQTESFGIDCHNSQILKDDTEKECKGSSDHKQQYGCPQNVEKKKKRKREKKDQLLTLPEDVRW